MKVSRRLERLEARAALAKRDWSFSSRLIIVDPEKGATGAIVFETGKPSTIVPPTPEEVESVRADLDRRRAQYQNQYGHDPGRSTRASQVVNS
jgi:hypothetical protein